MKVFGFINATDYKGHLKLCATYNLLIIDNRKMEKIQKQLISDLNNAGYHFRDINHLYKQDNYLPIGAINIILRWLPEIYKEHLGSGECLVRSLICQSDQYNPAVLINLFENSELNETLKNTIGHVLSFSNTTAIKDWLLSQLLDKEHSFGRAGLLGGIVPKGDFKTKDELKKFLFEIFDKYSYYETFQKLVQRYSSTDDIYFIEQKAQEANTIAKARQLMKVAEKIRTRKRTPSFP